MRRTASGLADVARTPTKEDRPGKPGPKPPKRNKQRLTKLSAAEVKAAQSGGWLDERVPEDLIARRLSSEPATDFGVPEIVRFLGKRMGWIRLMANPEAARMEPKEVAQQARDTAAVIDELLDRRLRFMHPELQAMIDGVLFQAVNKHVLAIRQAIDPDLRHLHAAALMVARKLEATPGKTGPKSTERKRAMTALSEHLQANSRPPLAKRRAQALAADLIAICEDNQAA